MCAVAKGDLKAFEEIVLRHQRTAWSAAYRFLGDAVEAEDVAQAAFLRLLAAAPRYHPTASLRTLLFRIISRLCIDHTRKMKPVYLDTIPDVPDPQPDATNHMANRERARAIQCAMNALPPAQRMAIVLRYYEDLDYRSIAEAMDTTEKAVERLLARARVALRVPLSQFRADETRSGGGFWHLARLYHQEGQPR